MYIRVNTLSFVMNLFYYIKHFKLSVGLINEYQYMK